MRAPYFYPDHRLSKLQAQALGARHLHCQIGSLKTTKRKLMLDVLFFNLTWVKTNLSLSDNFQII
jgi:hypothetical protein